MLNSFVLHMSNPWIFCPVTSSFFPQATAAEARAYQTVSNTIVSIQIRVYSRVSTWIAHSLTAANLP